jgi:hypothetical protein
MTQQPPQDSFADNIMPSPVENGFSQEGYWVWGSSVVKAEDGRYHMFVSRWPQTWSMHPGWMMASEIVRASSDTPMGPYQFEEVILGARGAEYWDGRSCHNPRIIKHKGRYLLFYTGITHPFDDPENTKDIPLADPRVIVSRSNKRIGVAYADSINGPWIRADKPTFDTIPDSYCSFFTSNPSPIVHKDSSVTLMFKARQYRYVTDADTKALRKDGSMIGLAGQMEIGLAKADHYLGPYRLATDEPIFTKDRFGTVEDPYIWQSPDGQYHMLAKDMTGDITGTPHSGLLAHSHDAMDWQLNEPPGSYTKNVTYEDGSTATLGQMERPFIFNDDDGRDYLFVAVMDGPGGFQNGTKSWNLARPLKLGTLNQF